MWPWGHAAVGYLVYSLGVRTQGRRVTAMTLVALAIGTQFPDLVDKPLGWTFGVLPGGRTLAHSLLTFVVITTLVFLVARRYRRPVIGIAFSVGYLSHSLADGLHAALEGEYADLTYLLWPVLPTPTSETKQSFLAHFAEMTVDPYFLFQLLLVLLAALLWCYDGLPGLAFARSIVIAGFDRIRRFVSAGNQ